MSLNCIEIIIFLQFELIKSYLYMVEIMSPNLLKTKLRTYSGFAEVDDCIVKLFHSVRDISSLLLFKVYLMRIIIRLILPNEGYAVAFHFLNYCECYKIITSKIVKCLVKTRLWTALLIELYFQFLAKSVSEPNFGTRNNTKQG